MNRRRNGWIIAVVVLLLLCCCATTVAAVVVGMGALPWQWDWNGDFSLNLDDLRENWGYRGTEASTTVEELFVTDEQAVLEVKCPVCNIDVYPGTESEIAVEAVKRAWGSSEGAAERSRDRIDVYVSQQGDRVIVEVDMPQLTETRLVSKQARVDLSIAVPTETDLEIDLNVGEIEVWGIEGEVDIQVDVGRVDFTDVRASESLSVRTDVAQILFKGRLVAGAKYDLRSDVGEIVMTLPDDSSFELNAESDVGGVGIEFDMSNQDIQSAFVGAHMRGTVGEGPMADLRLRSNVGSIEIKKD